jgi:hypothetical protein
MLVANQQTIAAENAAAEIDPNRRVDFTLKDGTRVCDSCFVKGTARATRSD